MQHLRGRIAKSDVRTTYVPRTYHVRTTYVPRTYVPRTYASSTVSRHFGAETKMYQDVGIPERQKVRKQEG